ncbi:RHS repeat-associated core domain-containing protein, partial [Acinetobacter johnsonii]|uniref:RHS repeat-associated core domain-containing protein n=1 Tax=Acinetobacter johnsonii TaxID=40214 RepID=UPI001F3CA33B
SGVYFNFVIGIVSQNIDSPTNPVRFSDLSGQIIWKAQYKAWGECKAEKVKSNFFENSEIISNNIRFQGQYFDEETGLHYNRHRYYSPYVGRFISKDPIGLLGGHNVYAYAPNPVEWVDPRGLTKRKSNKTKGNGGGKKQTCPGNPCEGKNPAAQAKKFQTDEDGTNPYYNQDVWKNIVVKKGTVLYTLHPHGPNKKALKNNTPNFFVRERELKVAKGAWDYNDRLQISHGRNTLGGRDMRTSVHKFVVQDDICVAIALTKANTHLGKGGGVQYFVSQEDKVNSERIKGTGSIVGL